MEEQNEVQPKRFRGYIESAVDDKGRILIDKKNRERLGSNFVAAMMPNGCLGLYRSEVWAQREADIEAQKSDNPGWEHYTRFLFKNVADELNCDSQGRFVLPQWLRESVNLKAEIVLLGAGDRLEIWNMEEFRKYEANPFEYGAEMRAKFERARDMMREEGRWEI